jgi:lysyl-tRNA synthetase class 2
VAALRRFFSEQGFLEVEPAILQVSPGNETHLHAFATELTAPDGARTPLYLHTSPEFACKKILAAGESKIFALVPVFRNRERGALHHPAFTMLEWYRAGAPYEALMEDCAELLATAARAADIPLLRFGRHSADPLAMPDRLSVADAFARYAGIDLLATLGGLDRDGLAAAARASGVRVPDDDTWGDIFSRVLVERIEGALGNGRATLLIDYPANLAALARTRAVDPRLAERFELYACGVELVNGFGELNDPGEQRRRLAAEMAEKERIYGERYPIDEDFLAALAEMPPASGAALGVDRLVMLLTGATDIEQVIWTPLPRPQC